MPPMVIMMPTVRPPYGGKGCVGSRLLRCPHRTPRADPPSRSDQIAGDGLAQEALSVPDLLPWTITTHHMTSVKIIHLLIHSHTDLLTLTLESLEGLKG